MTGPDAELTALRTEVAGLRSRLDTRARRAAIGTTVRRVTAAVLVALSAFALVASVVGLWAARTALDTDRWVETVAPLPRDPAVSAAVATYATDQLFRAVDVEQRLAAALPERLTFLAGPAAGQIRDQTRDLVTTVLRSDRFQPVWTELNRRAHQRALAIAEGTSAVVTAQSDHVDIDLLPLVNQVLRELSAQLPEVFGKQITLPDISSGAIPENLRSTVEGTLGVSLPEDFARFTVYDAGRLQEVQASVTAAKRWLALLVTATVVLTVLALLVSPARRRTVLQWGLWLVIAAVTVTAALRALRTQTLEQVPSGLYRDGAAAAMTTIFTLLRTRGEQLAWTGAAVALLAYLIGPGRLPVWLRRQARRGARWVAGHGRTAGSAVAARGPGWVAAHRDALRVGGVVAAVLLALLLSSWTALLVVVIVLAAFELAVTLIGRSPGVPGRSAS